MLTEWVMWVDSVCECTVCVGCFLFIRERSITKVVDGKYTMCVC